MAIDPVGIGHIQRILHTQTPDTGFFEAFKTAFAQQKDMAATAQALGQTHMEMAAQRDVSADDQAAFADILNRAYSSKGMDDPAAFLKTLSRQELVSIKRVHGLGTDIDPSNLSKEGAYNLLLPGGYTVDLDKDGVEEIGAARLIHFPPRDAPQGFVDAWSKASQDIEAGDLLTYSMIMHHAIHGISIGDGPPTGGKPSDNIDSYRTSINSYLDMLDRFRGQLPEGQYEKSKPFFTKLLSLINE